MTDAAQIHDDLARATAARQEKADLTHRLTAARGYQAAAAQRVDELRDKLSVEEADVHKLESFSPARILAGLRGSRSSDIERETAERDAAAYAVADAEARLAAATRDCEALASQVAELGDADAVHGRALAAKEDWAATHDPALSAALTEIAVRRGELVARDQEAREAHAAGLRAQQSLQAARQHLGGAQSWSTWDTFAGGGLLSDMAKYQRIDQATAMLRDADLALGSFSRELADVGMTAVKGVQIDNLSRTFDIFFDNFFSDLAVRSRIQNAAAQVERALQAVGAALQALQTNGHRMEAELAELDVQRERLLQG